MEALLPCQDAPIALFDVPLDVSKSAAADAPGACSVAGGLAMERVQGSGELGASVVTHMAGNLASCRCYR